MSSLAEEFLVILRDELHAGHLAEPFPLLLGHVAHRDQLGPNRVMVEDKPAAQRAGHFAAHQAATNDADPDRPGH